MQASEELAKFTPERPTVLTIGVFDGVHLGHQFLMNKVIGRARELGFLSVVVTLHPHPRAVLSEQFEPRYICSLSERIATIKSLGVDMVVPMTFTPELSRLNAREFIGLLREHLKMRELLVGADFALGRGRAGDVGALVAMGKEQGFQVTVVPPLVQNTEIVSSTSIRNALADGDVAKAARQLGRPVNLFGEVVEGDQRGRAIGFPTANLAYERERALPADGVYATRACLKDLCYDSVTNIGIRPTFSGKERTVEVFLIGFQGDIYRQELRIELVERLRGEQRFAGIEDLKDQIARDVETAKAALRR